MHTIYNKFKSGLSLALALSMMFVMVAIASDWNVSVVDVTAPTGSVTLAPGDSGPIVINIRVTGQQDGTATFKVYRDWTLSSGTFTGSNYQEFTVGPRGGGDLATTFTTSGTVTVAAGHTDGTFTLAVGAFGITNTNTTGAKLDKGKPGEYVVIVETPDTPGDTTAPVISYILVPEDPDGDNGWYKSNVTLTWTVSEPESPNSLTTIGCEDQNITADQFETTYSCSATSEGGSAGPVTVTIKRDATAPSISASLTPDAASSGWWNLDTGAPTVSFVCSDATSGIDSCPDAYTFGEGENQSQSGTANDNAGNSASAGVDNVDVDLTAPTLTWIGGPASGGTYYSGFVPGEPTCNTIDELSGPDGCDIVGYSSNVGEHTMTATAKDKAGNTYVETRTYTVLSWDFYGFFKPVNMDSLNIVKGGSTVPLKFQIFVSEVEQTSLDKIDMSVHRFACDSFESGTTLTETATGGTSLRYDNTAGQYVYNWQTPKGAGVCYKVTATYDGGPSISANFMTK